MLDQVDHVRPGGSR